MKTYLIKFRTNYEEAAIIINTDNGIEYVKEQADILGAWDGFEIEEINTQIEGAYRSVNFGELCGILKTSQYTRSDMIEFAKNILNNESYRDKPYKFEEFDTKALKIWEENKQINNPKI